MAERSLLVLVSGATGRQGGAVVRALRDRGHRLRALVRNPRTPAAESLRRSGVELCPGSLEDAAAVESAARDVDAFFLMGTPFEHGPAAEVQQGRTAVEAARTARVPFVTYSSVAGATRKTGIPHFESKFQVEQGLRASGVPFAIVAPVFFMENVTTPSSIQHLARGELVLGLTADRPLQMVALANLGAFVAHVLENPSFFRGRRVEIASDETTGARAAEVLSRVTGRPIRYPDAAESRAPAPPADDRAIMRRWLQTDGYSVDIAALKREAPAIGWLAFEAWAREQDWSALLA
jgi:uncharacterized protein YbjT (DUF2867 family)